MGKIIDFLAGVKVLEVVDSPINGKISVVKSVAFGTYLQAGGLTQSGGIVKSIWDKTLNVVCGQKLEVGKCLILGLGGGSLAELVNKYWPEAETTGVDIDPVMVELGKKYLGMDDKKIKVVISDAFDFLTAYNQKPTTYNLILIDLYRGDEFPEKFETENYIRLVKKLLTANGVVVFNRLYYDEKRTKAVKFMHKLEKHFNKVEAFYPEANVMFICN